MTSSPILYENTVAWTIWDKSLFLHAKGNHDCNPRAAHRPVARNCCIQTPMKWCLNCPMMNMNENQSSTKYESLQLNHYRQSFYTILVHLQHNISSSCSYSSLWVIKYQVIHADILIYDYQLNMSWTVVPWWPLESGILRRSKSLKPCKITPWGPLDSPCVTLTSDAY